MRIDRRTLIGAGAAALLGRIGAAWAQDEAVTPEMFGARGDGSTNDTAAFAAMSAHINARGGGVVALRRVTYVVGRQTARRGGEWSFEPEPIMLFERLRGALTIRGNGARLQCAPGLRFGAFDAATRRPVNRPLPNLRVADRATPYLAMLVARGCRGPIEIADLELDGSVARLVIGGPYGDIGRQVPATGLLLQNNVGSETIRNVHSHHHALDGVIVDGVNNRASRSRFDNVVCDYNGRQGLSIVGGRGYDFRGCRFSHTGKAGVHSPPGAGVDIEAEGGKQNRDLNFTDCEFSHNSGAGMVADSGDSAQVGFTRCTFVGSSSWAAWPRKPFFRFDGCTFVGAIAQTHPDPDPARATQFVGCTFLDDPERAGGQGVYLGGTPSGTIADLNVGENVLFQGCAFRLTHNGLLPWSMQAIYRDCDMRQAAQRASYPRGSYLGRTTIQGNAVLDGSIIPGTVLRNGTIVPSGRR
jgi:hypothetical protein